MVQTRHETVDDLRDRTDMELHFQPSPGKYRKWWLNRPTGSALDRPGSVVAGADQMDGQGCIHRIRQPMIDAIA